MDYQDNAIGLLFGGLEFFVPPSGPRTVVASWYSPIDPVLQQLGVHLP